MIRLQALRVNIEKGMAQILGGLLGLSGGNLLRSRTSEIIENKDFDLVPKERLRVYLGGEPFY